MSYLHNIIYIYTLGTLYHKMDYKVITFLVAYFWIAKTKIISLFYSSLFETVKVVENYKLLKLQFLRKKNV